MITLELSDVEIDHCVNCGGIWLDAGELELLMDDPMKARRLLDAFREDTAADEEPRKCPICDKRMAKIRVGDAPKPLLIDKCRHGDGLWFDKGELRDILNRGQLDERSQVQRLLADMFGAEIPADQEA
jgi:hypothetical protein